MGTQFDLSHYNLEILAYDSPHRKPFLESRENYQDVNVKNKSRHKVYALDLSGNETLFVVCS